MGCNCQNNISENQDCQELTKIESLSNQWSDFFSRNMAIIFGGAWDKAINSIEERIAWNDFSWYDPSKWTRQVQRGAIEKTLNSYTNYILEFDTAIEFYDEWKIKNGDNAQWDFLKKVADIAALDVNLCRRILDHLVWATKDGTIKDQSIWKPRLNQYYDLRTKTPEKADSVWNSKLLQGGLSLFKNLDWILPVALIGAGLYVAFPFISTARKTAEVASGKS